ncbi:MAG TPA: aminoacetone oxidase family FAD-binding enzyme, partial [Epsilonproteobacteria bacterium]|nr:aminoacetone oxidase family FAD-binding enzyme [Campylobacterota bacterium]
MKETEIIIIGAGASGLMAASLLPPNTATVIESGTKAGNKLLISGGGKCNITNRKMETSCFLGEAYFIEPALSSFDNEALLTWLRGKGLNPVVRKETQYFCPHSAKEIVQLFQKESQKQQIRLNEKVISVTKKGNLFVVKTEKQVLQCKKVVVASGGLSYP